MAQQFTIEVTFDSSGAVRKIKRTTRDLDNMNRSVDRGISLLRAYGLALGSIRGLKAFGDLADETQNVRNRLLALGESTSNTEILLSKLNATAQATRSSFKGTTDLYTRLLLASKDLGRSQDELLGFTKSLNQAVILSGATAREAEAAIIQLSQGLASGTLRGDELRSVLEQLPKVADVIAKGLNVSRGELKKLGEDGKISAQAVIGAFEAASDSLDSQFGKTTATVSQNVQVLKNDFLTLVDASINQTGVIKNLGTAFKFLSDKIKTAIDGYQLLLGITTQQVEQIQREEMELAGLGRRINVLNKELRSLEQREIITPVVQKRIDDLTVQLALLKLEAQKTNTAVASTPKGTLEERAEDAKQAAFFQQLYNKALSDATRPGEKFELQLKAINQLLDEGKITQGQANALVERYRETIQRLERGSVSAFDRRLKQLVDENNIRRQSITFGEIEGEILRRRLVLQAEGKTLTDEQANALRKELEVRNNLIDLEERREAAAEKVKERLAAEKEATALLERQADTFAGLTDSFDRFALEANNTRKVVNDIANSFANQLTNAITEFVTTGKASFKEFANALLADITRIIARLLVVQALSALGGGSSLGGLLGGGASSGLAGARASGGPVNRNKQYLVGENGPELFTPGENGKITSNKDMQQAPQQMPAPQTNLQVVNVTDPSMVPEAIGDGSSDDAIINVLGRNADQIRNILQG